MPEDEAPRAPAARVRPVATRPPRGGTRWPAISFEEVEWRLDPRIPVSNTARRRHRAPYEAAVVPEIARAVLELPSDAVSQAEDAASELARFDAEVGHEIAPFAAVLLRSESAASSRIENLTASARAIAEAELAHGWATQPGPEKGRAGRNASLIVANQRAMTAAIGLADRIDAEAIRSMHAALLELSHPEIAGRWRTQQVWIGGSDFGPHGATFVPPQASRVIPAIHDLVAFIDRDDLPVLVHAALAHAQLETIHPFADGNGRTGRALVHAQLRNKRLTRNVTVPVSAGLLVSVDRYFDALTSYRAGDPIPIVERFTSAAISAVANGRQLVEELQGLRAAWQGQIRVRRGAHAWRVMDLALRHPVLDAALVAAELGLAAPNAYRSVQPLVDAGVLEIWPSHGGRLRWRAPQVLRALDAFAARAGRRAPLRLRG